MYYSMDINIFNSHIPNNKNIILIGNSPNVKNKHLGNIINTEYFNIIRFNLQQTKNYEQYVGGETTFRFVNGITWVDKNKEIENDNIVIAEPKYSPFFEKIFNINLTRTFKSISRIPDYTKNYTDIFPTSGLMAISFFLQFYDKIYIYGFSYQGNHFYDNSTGESHHKYDVEKNIIESLIRHGRIIYLDEKINIPLPFIVFNQIDYSINKDIIVLENKHNFNQSKFNYFHFSRSKINLPRGKIIYVQAIINYCKIYLVLFGYPNHAFNVNTQYIGCNFDHDYDPRGNAHGKDILEKYKFLRRDKISIKKILTQINILSLSHKHGQKDYGKYFHFNFSDLESLNLHEDSNKSILLNIIHPVKKVEKEIIIWKKNNGGMYGDSHGRFKNNPKYGDFINCNFLLVT